jgi:predicted ester cyclase
VHDFIAVMHTQVFDARPEVQSVVVDDGAACLEAVFVGSQIGEFAGMPPTGAQVRVPYSIVYEINDQLITEMRAYMPLLALVGQVQAAADSARPTPVSV